MQAISLNEKKRILLDILIEIDSFCRSNNIQYFITGGTLLGAVRHKGFIPWDDDIDVCFMRDDYDKFVSTFVSVSGNIDILNYKNTKKYIWSYSKAIDKRTYLEENGFRIEKMGVYVDLFPMDNLGNTYSESKRTVKNVKKYKDLLTIKHLKIDKRRFFFKNILILLAKVLYLINDSFFIEKITKKSLCFKDKEVTFIGNLSGAWGYKEITMSSYFRLPIEIEFEGHVFFAPIDYDKYLEDVYGNYLELPPKEKQIAHHSSKEYWRD